MNISTKELKFSLQQKHWFHPRDKRQSKKENNLRVGDGDFDLDTRFNRDGSDLLDHIRRAEEINHSLVHPKFESVPCVGSC